jgi:hypothetical protein
MIFGKTLLIVVALVVIAWMIGGVLRNFRR